MNSLFWQRMHGGSTHFPIVLLLASVVFDFFAWRSRDDGLRRGLGLAGFGSAIVGVMGAVGAIASGLVMSRGQMLGTGFEKLHHFFIWPAFGLCAALVAVRLFKRGQIFSPALYLAGMALASALMMGAGYWGGEMLLGAPKDEASARVPISPDKSAMLSTGHKLYLLNCAHCHGEDATGDEGPDLHGVTKSDARIAAMIKNGVKGEMPKFGSKLTDTDVHALITFIHSLN